jgi:hypothetical protein
MSLVAYPTRRRQFMLGALTVLLHLIVFRWVVTQIGQPRDGTAHTGAPPPATQLVEVEPTPPPAAPAPSPPLPLPAPPPPLPDLAPEPVEVATADVPGPAAAPPAASAPAAGGAADASASPTAAAAPPPPPPPPQQQSGRRYRIDLPPSAELKLDVVRIDADGSRWTGEETMSWTMGADGYSVRIEAALKLMFAHINLLTLTSEGKLGDEGFAPILMMERRRGRSATATHFDRDKTNLLTFSASQARWGLQPYMQDKATMPLELTAIARADPQQLSGKLEFIVGEDHDINVYNFTLAGQEEIETRMGRIATWHMVRPPKPGSYSSRLDLWLAPDHGWYPVQVRNVEANGATTTQTVSSIVTIKKAEL